MQKQLVAPSGAAGERPQLAAPKAITLLKLVVLFYL
jgi:hypothetical protein